MSKLIPTHTNRAPFVPAFISLMGLLLLGVVASCVAGGVTLEFDRTILFWINSHANSSFDSFFVVITELGGVLVVTSVTLALFIYLLFKKAYSKAVLIALGVGGAAAFGYILKAVFERTRPDLWEWLVVETNFSFPSGHAIGSSALALCIVALLWQTKWRTFAIVGASMYALIVSLSRLYVGVHYPSDILGGWLLSTAWVTLVTSIVYLYLIDNPKKKSTL